MKQNPSFFQPISHEELSKSQSEDNWSFGERFECSAKELMAKVYSVLESEGISIDQKSTNYKIKCKLIRTGNLTTTNSQMEIEDTEPLKDENEERSSLHLPKFGEMKSVKKPKAKKDKYSKKELIFGIQIYSLPNSDSHLLDVRFYKGHPMIFLDFCSKFLSNLKKII